MTDLFPTEFTGYLESGLRWDAAVELWLARCQTPALRTAGRPRDLWVADVCRD